MTTDSLDSKPGVDSDKEKKYKGTPHHPVNTTRKSKVINKILESL